jgi:hypothetical protein
MKHVLRNWKTSLAGVGTIIVGVSKIVSGDIAGGATLVIAGVGLLSAKDADKTGLGLN